MPLDSKDQLRQLTEDAAQMILDLEEHGSEEGEARLAAWLANSPMHMDAYLRTTVALGEFARIDAACEAAKRRVLAGAGDSRTLATVAVLPRRVAPSSARTNSRLWVAAAAVAAAILGGMLLGYLKLHEVKPHTPSLTVVQHNAVPAIAKVTIYDQPGFVHLGPNSLLRLSNRSRVEVTEFTGHRGPQVTVTKGEVWFSGHHDPKSPLSVVMGTGSLDVMGTQFEIQRAGQRTRVTVLEGEVRLDACGQSLPAPEVDAVRDGSSAVTLTPNRTATFDDQDCKNSLKVEKVDPHRPIKGVVFSPDGKTVEFRNVTVGDALESLNRIHPEVLMVADTSLQDVKFWGRFPVDPDGFIRLLQRMYKIQAEREPAAAGDNTFICLKAAR